MLFNVGRVTSLKENREFKPDRRAIFPLGYLALDMNSVTSAAVEVTPRTLVVMI